MKEILSTFTFASSSGSKTYETIQYVDLNTSCNCMGWTRRVGPDGSRTCKHTRMIDTGRADVEALSVWDNPARLNASLRSVQPPLDRQAESNNKKLARIRKQLNKNKMVAVPQRSVNWR
jgi:hypothetical protein